MSSKIKILILNFNFRQAYFKKLVEMEDPTITANSDLNSFSKDFYDDGPFSSYNMDENYDKISKSTGGYYGFKKPYPKFHEGLHINSNYDNILPQNEVRFSFSNHGKSQTKFNENYKVEEKSDDENENLNNFFLEKDDSKRQNFDSSENKFNLRDFYMNQPPEIDALNPLNLKFGADKKKYKKEKEYRKNKYDMFS